MAARLGRGILRAHLIPDRVRIAGVDIDVMRDTSPGENEAFGYFQQTAEGAVIVIDERVAGMRELSVFFHELSHAISETFGLGLKHRQVYGLGEGLAQALSPLLRIPGKSRTSSPSRPRTQKSARKRRTKKVA